MAKKTDTFYYSALTLKGGKYIVFAIMSFCIMAGATIMLAQRHNSMRRNTVMEQFSAYKIITFSSLLSIFEADSAVEARLTRIVPKLSLKCKNGAEYRVASESTTGLFSWAHTFRYSSLCTGTSCNSKNALIAKALSGKSGVEKYTNYVDNDVYGAYTYNEKHRFALLYESPPYPYNVENEFLSQGIVTTLVTTIVFCLVARLSVTTTNRTRHVVFLVVAPFLLFLGMIALILTLNSIHFSDLVEVSKYQAQESLRDYNEMVEIVYEELGVPVNDFLALYTERVDPTQINNIYSYRRQTWSTTPLLSTPTTAAWANASNFIFYESSWDPNVRLEFSHDNIPSLYIATAWNEVLRVGHSLFGEFSWTDNSYTDDSNSLWKFGLSGVGSLMVVLYILAPRRDHHEIVPRNNYPVGPKFAAFFGLLSFAPVLVLNLIGASTLFAVNTAYQNTTSLYNANNQFIDFSKIAIATSMTRSYSAQYTLTRNDDSYQQYAVNRDNLLKFPLDSDAYTKFYSPLMPLWWKKWDTVTAIRRAILYYHNSVASSFASTQPSSDLELAYLSEMESKIKELTSVSANVDASSVEQQRQLLLAKSNTLRNVILDQERLWLTFLLTSNTTYYQPRSTALDNIGNPIRDDFSRIDELVNSYNRIKKASQTYSATLSQLDDIRSAFRSQTQSIADVASYVNVEILKDTTLAYETNNQTVMMQRSELAISSAADIPFQFEHRIVNTMAATSFVAIVFVGIGILIGVYNVLETHSHPNNPHLWKFMIRIIGLWVIMCGGCIILIALNQYFANSVLDQYQEAVDSLTLTTEYYTSSKMMLLQIVNGVYKTYQGLVSLDAASEQDILKSWALADLYFVEARARTPEDKVEAMDNIKELLDQMKAVTKPLLSVMSTLDTLESPKLTYTAVGALVSQRVEQDGLDDSVMATLTNCVQKTTGQQQALLSDTITFVKSYEIIHLRALLSSNYTIKTLYDKNFTSIMGKMSISTTPCVQDSVTSLNKWSKALLSEVLLVQQIDESISFGKILKQVNSQWPLISTLLQKCYAMSLLSVCGATQRCVQEFEDLAKYRAVFWIPVIGTWALVVIGRLLWAVIQEAADVWNYHSRLVEEDWVEETLEEDRILQQE